MTFARQPLVSIVVPVYNAERFIEETINAVRAQTHSNWQLTFVDDASSDRSVDIIRSFLEIDKRIQLISSDKNIGAAMARNQGVDNSRGDYLAFLDADDIWLPEKLERQLAFMQRKDSVFSFGSYQFVNHDGVGRGSVVVVPEKIAYHQALKNTTIFTSSVMFNLSRIEQSELHMPSIGSEDTALWWKVLRKGVVADGFNETYVLYRRSADTLSSNKLHAVKRTWRLYRDYEGLGVIKSSYYFCWYIFNAVVRRI